MKKSDPSVLSLRQKRFFSPFRVLLLGLLFLVVAGMGAAARLDSAEMAGTTSYPAFNELSFLYDGVPFSPETFTCSVAPAGGNSEYTQKNVVYLARDGKLQIRLDYKLYKNYPAFEYTVRLANLSPDEETGLVENFMSLGTTVSLPVSDRDLFLDVVGGSLCNPNDFTPNHFVIRPLKQLLFPFYRVDARRSGFGTLPLYAGDRLDRFMESLVYKQGGCRRNRRRDAEYPFSASSGRGNPAAVHRTFHFQSE